MTERLGRGKIWSSISVKLTLAIAVVSIMGIILVAFFIRQGAQGEFNHYVKVRSDGDISTRLASYYAAHQSWDGVAAVFNQPTPTPPPMTPMPWPRAGLTVVNTGGQVVYVNSVSTYKAGSPVSPDVLSDAIAIQTGGQTVGWLIVDSPPAPVRTAYSPETDYINRMTNASVIAALIAIIGAVVIGASLARTLSHPIKELTEATRKVARGALGTQVAVRTRDELGALAQSFNQMSADLAQSINLRRQMTADIAHELRSPLSVILGYTEALSEAKLPGSPEIYQSLHVEARHLQRLIDDLRLLSLADAGELPLTLQPSAPRLLLEQVRMSYASQASRHHVSLSVEAPDNLPDLFIDPDRMAQVLGNLVNNALRYTPARGEIVLSAGRRGSQVELRVRDTGAGISPEDLPNIFVRFYRGDEARFSETGESGLGLAIAKSIIEAHHGSVTVESVEGKGSTFIILLPVHKP